MVSVMAVLDKLCLIIIKKSAKKANKQSFSMNCMLVNMCVLYSNSTELYCSKKRHQVQHKFCKRLTSPASSFGLFSKALSLGFWGIGVDQWTLPLSIASSALQCNKATDLALHYCPACFELLNCIIMLHKTRLATNIME